MDAVKFLMENKRMCQNFKVCSRCPLHGNCISSIVDSGDAIKTVEIVEKWSEEHPVKTNGMKVWELIPGYVRSTNSRPAKENALLGQIVESEYIELLVRKSWWDEEYKEGEK